LREEREMVSLIYNETRKLLTRKKTLVVFIAFILLVGFMMFASYKEDQTRKKYSSPEFRIQNMEQSLEYLNKMKDDPKILEQDKKHFIEEIERTEKELKELKENPNPKETDWKKELNQRIQSSEAILKEAGMPESEKERIKLEIEQFRYLLDNNIKYDENNLNAFNFLKMLFEILGIVFLAVGVMMFTGDVVSGEYTPPTMKFLITQPVSRAKVLFSKFLAVVLTSVILILAVEIIAYVLMGIMFGFGDTNYPMFVGTRYEYDLTKVVNEGHPFKTIVGSTYMISRTSFIIRGFLIQILFIIAAASFAFLLSTVLKSSMVSISLSIVTVIVLAILQNLPYVSKAAPYLFTTYGNSFSLMQGQLPLNFQNPVFTTNLGIGVLAGWSIACYLAAHAVFVRRDILI
jgi:ABC-2 type transport system permease protein